MNAGCPIYDSKKYLIKGKGRTNHISKDIINTNYDVVQCTNCFLYYVNPQINFSDEQWSKLYNNEYFADSTEWLEKKRKKELDKRLVLVQKYLGNRETVKLLDIGTGEGKLLIEGIKRNWEVTGIDIVDNRIEQAKSDQIKFIKAKFLDYEFSENNYDIIYLDSVLEHVIDPLNYLLKVKRILKQGGIIYIGVPNEDCLFNDIRKFGMKFKGQKEITEKIKPFDSPYHIIGFNKTSLNFLIIKTNLKIKLMQNIGRKLEFLGYKPTKRGFWISLLFLLPIEMISTIIKRDLYYSVYLTKEKN